jgi:hypothetical protein
MAILPKSNLHVQGNPHQNSNDIHDRNCKINPEVHLEALKTTNSQGNVEQKGNAEGITIPEFKLHYRSIELKTAWYQHKDRYEDQGNRIEDLDMNPHNYAQQVFDKCAKNIWWRKHTLFNKCSWKNWISA